MTRDASLDDFEPAAGDEADDEESPEASSGEGNGEESSEASSGGMNGEEGSVGSADGDEGHRDPSAVEPAVATSRFAPDGASCADCEAVVERVWLAAGEEVCVDCKPW